MDERQKDILFKQNPHWNGGQEVASQFKRDAYNEVDRLMTYPQIVGIVGLRRVGKTIILKQIMAKLLKTAPGRNVGYISFDDRDFRKYESAYELIGYFLSMSDKKTMRYLLLDEVQKVPDWPDLLKTIYDMEPELKMVISGSSSLELKKYTETLAGRIFTVQVPVFSFGEYLRYYGFDHQVDTTDLLRDYDLRFLTKRTEYAALFERYLLKGAFPELLKVEEEDVIKRYIRESVIEKVVMDISSNILPRREDVTEELVKIFSKNTGRLFEMSGLSNALGLDRNKVAEYVDALKKAFLIQIVHNYTKSAMKQARTSKKAHIVHSSIPIALFNYPFALMDMDGEDRGYLVESTIACSLKDQFFWRTPQKHEVDIILAGKSPTPVEVKYRQEISKSDLTGLFKFAETFKTKRAIVVTKDLLREEEKNNVKLLYVPAWLFLLGEWGENFAPNTKNTTGR